jgi:PAS domain S-box-containing protein
VDVLTYLASVAIERRRSEEERATLLNRERAARAEAETMLGQIADAVIVIDETGRTTYLNGAAKRLLGVDATGVPAARRSELYGMLTPEGAPFQAEELPSMRSMRERRVITGVDMLVRCPDGREIPVQENAAPIVAEDGRVIGAIATVRDISAQHELERQKEEFLAAVAHDLKNPIAVLQGQAQLLRRRAERGPLEQERVREGLQLVENRARMMTGLIDQLLDVTRLRLGQELQLERQPVDLGALVQEVVQAAQQMTDDHELRVVLTAPELIGNWDRQRLIRVLENLLNNAIKYSPEGGEVIVSVAQDEADERGDAVVRVQDRGIGIPAKDLPHIFEQFYRAGNTAGRMVGTGIGLAGARQIVEQHGGTLTVESEEGRGSTFALRLPLRSPNGAPPDGADTSADRASA